MNITCTCRVIILLGLHVYFNNEQFTHRVMRSLHMAYMKWGIRKVKMLVPLSRVLKLQVIIFTQSMKITRNIGSYGKIKNYKK